MAGSTESGEKQQPVDERAAQRAKALEIFEHALGTLAELGGFVLSTSNDDDAGALIVRVQGARRDVDGEGFTVFTARESVPAAAA